MATHLIHGKVSYAPGAWGTGVPVPYATVQIWDRDLGGDGHDLIWEGTTNAHGHFEGMSREWIDANTARLRFQGRELEVLVPDFGSFYYRIIHAGHDSGEISLPQLGEFNATVDWGPDMIAADPARNAELRALLAKSHQGGLGGFYLKHINGSVLYGYNQSVAFDPASAIKALVHAHALRGVEARAFINGQPITLMSTVPAPLGVGSLGSSHASCPFDETNSPEDSLPLPLGKALESMMKRSRNAPTEAIRRYFGAANVDITAAQLQMMDTQYLGAVGCTRNYTTLIDLGRLYECAASGFLHAASWSTFVHLAANTPIYEIDRTITTAAATIPNCPPDFLGRFRRRILNVSKSGAGGGEQGQCRTVAGYIALPQWHDGRIILQEFVYGCFVDLATSIKPDPENPSSEFNLNRVVAETLRHEVESAVISFRNATDRI